MSLIGELLDETESKYTTGEFKTYYLWLDENLENAHEKEFQKIEALLKDPFDENYNDKMLNAIKAYRAFLSSHVQNFKMSKLKRRLKTLGDRAPFKKELDKVTDPEARKELERAVDMVQEVFGMTTGTLTVEAIDEEEIDQPPF